MSSDHSGESRSGHCLLVAADAALQRQVELVCAASAAVLMPVDLAGLAGRALPRPGCVVSAQSPMALLEPLMQEAERTRRVAMPAIALVAAGDVTATRLAFRAGVFDVVEVEHVARDLGAALQAALLSDRRKITDRDSAHAAYQRLSPRECDVFWLVTNGHTNREIAAVLGLSPRTVEAFRSRLMLRLDARNLADLLRVRFVLEPPAVKAGHEPRDGQGEPRSNGGAPPAPLRSGTPRPTVPGAGPDR